MENASHIHLFGDPEENFYSLGKKDKEGYFALKEQITQLCMRSQHAEKIVKFTQKLHLIYTKSNVSLTAELEAYAEGLEENLNDLYFTYLLPEVVAGFNKWVPNLLSLVPGCSSTFMLNHEGQILHNRILDYALSGPFQANERTVLYEFKNRYKVFSVGTRGMPLAGITAFNDRGLTVALHYKHGNYFDQKGHPIFSILHQAISYCANVNELYKYLRQFPSCSHWGICASDSLGKVAHIELKGHEVTWDLYDMEEYKFLNFNNRPIKFIDNSLQPYGNQNQCMQRSKDINKKLESFKLPVKNSLLSYNKQISKLSLNKAQHARNYNFSAITPSSVQNVAINAQNAEMIMLRGPGPKFFRGNYNHLSNVFSEIEIKAYNKKKDSLNIEKGYDFIASAQSYMDIGETKKAYHQLQMARALFKDYPDEFIVYFYFLIWDYLFEKNKKDKGYIYREFCEIEEKLPIYLKDHCLLFQLRLEKILELPQKNRSSEVNNLNLKKLYNKEYKLNGFAINQFKKFIIPRIEILDVIYLYP